MSSTPPQPSSRASTKLSVRSVAVHVAGAAAVVAAAGVAFVLLRRALRGRNATATGAPPATHQPAERGTAGVTTALSTGSLTMLSSEPCATCTAAAIQLPGFSHVSLLGAAPPPLPLLPAAPTRVTVQNSSIDEG